MVKIQRFLTIIVLICTMYCHSFAQQSLQWRIFTKSNNTWLCSPSGLQIFSSASRAVRPVTIDLTRTVTFFSDFIEYEGYILASSDAGLYQIDMNSLGSERIALPEDKIIRGKIAVDMDYLWLAANDDLYSFDKLSREWQTYHLPENTDSVIGAYSTGEEVFCIGQNSLYRFTVATEKWNTYKLEKSIPDSAAFFMGSNSFKVIDKALIRQYQPSSFSWELTGVAQPVQDIFDEDSVLYFSIGPDILKLTTATGIARPLDIPGIGQTGALTKFSDTLILATANRLVKFNTKTSSMEFIEYPEGSVFTDLEKIAIQGAFLILVYKTNISFYDNENRVWQTVPRSELKQRVSKLSWNDDGLKIKYAPGFQSVLTGSIEDNISFKFKGYEYDTVYNPDMKINKLMLMGLSSTDPILKATGLDTIKGLPLINLDFRTTDPKDRNLELFFDNTSKTAVPLKGVQYRGNRDDRLNTIKVGTTSNDQLSSASIPSTQIEGGSVVVESKKRVENRDRKVLKVAAGYGYITTRTEWRMLPFQPGGIYYLKQKNLSDSTQDLEDSLSYVSDNLTDDESDSLHFEKDSTRIVPGSVRVWVDGELFDSTQYTFYSEIGKLQFVSSAPIDPVSAIAVQYKVQTIPDGRISDVEFIPEHNFGLLHYGAITLSPKEWISARVGFVGIDSDAHYTSSSITHPIINIASPVEIRRQNLLLKFNPDFSYDTKSGARAGSASLQSRIGEKVGFVFNGMTADKNYITSDTLTYGYGTIENQYDFTVSYDITKDIPLSYYQHRRQATDGTESRYSAQAGVHFPGFPFLDITLSRNEIEHETRSDSTQTAFDSLFDTKDKVRFRLYETSSKYLENITRIRKISYDFSYSEYRTESGDQNWTYGRMSTAEMTIAPIQTVSVRGNLLYRSGTNIDSVPSTVLRPGLEVQTIDAPKGVDITASYYFQYSRYSLADSSTDSITRSLGIILKPGQWYAPLRWLSPRASISQNVNFAFNMARPEMIHLITAYHQMQNSTTTGGFGFHIFPSSEILLRNFNEWTQTDAGKIFSTENDFQVWFGTRNFWQVIWNYTSEKEYHDGSLRYDRVLTPWLRAQPRLAASYITDSLGTKLDGGPAFTLNLNFQNIKFIKSLFNSHDLKITWTRRNGITTANPQVGYTFNLSTVILPNIQISNFETVTFNDQNLIDFQSRINMIVNF